MTTTSQRIEAWTMRKADGTLLFPRTVAAHLYEIDAFDNSILTDRDIQQITNHENNQNSKWKNTN